MAEPSFEKPLHFLVELAAPEAGWKDVDRLIRRARESNDGPTDAARFVRAIFVPESSNCFLLFEADSAGAAAAAARRIDVEVERVSEVLQMRGEGAPARSQSR